MLSGLRLAAASVIVAFATIGAATAGPADGDPPDTEPQDAVHLDDASLPDPSWTPGDFNDRAKAADLCDDDKTEKAATPTHALCDGAFAERGISGEHQYEYACVFLVPTTIGGIPTKRNVWLQPASETHWKRTLDDEIRKRVCKNDLAVPQAQKEMAGDWVRAYRRYILPTDRLIVRAQPAYDPKDDPGRSRTVRGLSQDQAVVPADVPQTASQNSQPIEASVTQGLGQSGLQGGLQGGLQSGGGGLGGPQTNGGGAQRGGTLQPGFGPRSSRSVTSARRSAGGTRALGR